MGGTSQKGRGDMLVIMASNKQETYLKPQMRVKW
jgi:hypothetical protein